MVRGLALDCADKGPLFFLDAAEARPPKPLTPVVRRTECAGEPVSVRGGCMCPEDSTIQNPCNSGGGFPEVKGSSCLHECLE